MFSFSFVVFVRKLVGDGECTVFVKVLTAKDRWARTGWCFESYCQGDEKRTAVLERTSSPRKEVTRPTAVGFTEPTAVDLTKPIAVDQTYCW